MPTLSRANCVVRRKLPSDEGFIRELARDAFGEYSRRAGAQTLAMSQQPNAVTLIATQGTEPAGFAIVELGKAVVWLQAIAVTPSGRGRGIGRRLLAGVEALARSRGASRIGLATAEANLGALELFIKYGFSIERTRRSYYARGQTAHLMTKRL
jgi:ribosomal protein S18 acetylase RimI-like enzyme